MTPYLSILKQYFGFSSFRGIQQDIIESIGAGQDTLGLMPTGGGKSITFQVPALAREGLCLVISPLIALMKDQVGHLRRKGIKATAVYSGMTHDEVIIALENCILGDYKFLYVSPERLSSELFQAKLKKMHVSFITVDEAHCISQWGYDFRPAYTEIARIRKLLPGIPVLALTATATPDVVEDIQRQLQFRQKNVCRMSFERKNLIYSVQHIGSSKEQTIHELLLQVDGTAIVYTRSRMATHEIANYLTKVGITATFYHAGLTNRDKNERAAAWQKGDIRVMVATNAFGMGIDKPDVRLVIHSDVPDAPEAYFQEAGRAGRDGLTAHAVLLYDDYSQATVLLYDRRDCKKLLNRIHETFPEPDYIRQVYEDVCYFLQMAMGDGYGVTREFALDRFCVAFRHFPVRAYNALGILSRAGYIEWADAEDNMSRVMMVSSREELYTFHLPPLEERLLSLLLRSYTGIFSEYAFIDEGFIAQKLAIPEQQICELLINLSRRNIISFIPRKFIPHITFTRERIEREYIVLPPIVYADRKREMATRVQTMIAYLNTTECHSRFLLRYFGEKNAHDCGQCDNCREHDVLPALDDDAVRQRILERYEQLKKQQSDNQVQATQPSLFDFHMTDIPDSVVGRILHQMLEAEEISLNPNPNN